jgi:hypothetical protein
MIEVGRVPLPSTEERNPREWLYAATLRGKGVPDDQAIWLLAPHRELAIPKPQVTSGVHEGMLEVSSPVYCHGVHLEDDGREILADNYFDLLPNVPQRIPITVAGASPTFQLAPVMPIDSQ